MSVTNESLSAYSVKIEINLETALASVSGGDYGPGKADASIGMGISYIWSMGINTLAPNKSKEEQQNITQTLNSIISIIAGTSHVRCQSFPTAGSGSYDGVSLTLSQCTIAQAPIPSAGQMQIYGINIDIIDANNPIFGGFGCLPKGTFIGISTSGVTKRPLLLNIV